MTTEQQLFWVTFGAIGLLAFMVFMWGIACAKYYDECSRNAFLNVQNLYLKDQLNDTIRKLTAEIEARKETSELHLKTGYEPNQTQTTIDQQGLGNEWLYTNLNKH
jgi:hypothetical protein